MTMADAVMAPRKYEALKKDVKAARSFGWPSSPINADPEIIQRTMPKPRSTLATTYIATMRASA